MEVKALVVGTPIHPPKFAPSIIRVQATVSRLRDILAERDRGGALTLVGPTLDALQDDLSWLEHNLEASEAEIVGRVMSANRRILESVQWLLRDLRTGGPR